MISEAVTGNAKQLRHLTPTLSVPLTVAHNFRPFYPQVWVDRIIVDGLNQGVVSNEWRAALYEEVRKLHFKPSEISEVMFASLSMNFCDWLAGISTTSMPSTTAAWMVGSRILQTLLFQVILVDYPVESLKTFQERINASPNCLDYAKGMKDLKPRKK